MDDILYNGEPPAIENVLFTNSAVLSLRDFLNIRTVGIEYHDRILPRDLLEYFRNTYSANTTINRIGFAFHYSNYPIPLFLNQEPFFTDDDLEEDVGVYSQNVQFMIDLLLEFKSITHVDFLACNTLQSVKWKQYYQLLQRKTGVVIGASDNNTGNLKYGGDWIMESTQEDVVQIYFTAAIENWASLLALPTTLNTYYHTFYTVNGNDTNAGRVMTRTIYNNAGELLDTQNISYGMMNISTVLSLMDGGGTNPYTVGIVDSSLNMISMDLAFCAVYRKHFKLNQQKNLMTHVNKTYKEPHTYMTDIFTVTFSDGSFFCRNKDTPISLSGGPIYSFDQSDNSNVMTFPISLSGGSVYLFDQSDNSNAGYQLKLSSTSSFWNEITSGILTNSIPGSLNAYTIISPTTNISVYLCPTISYVKVGLNILSQPVFLISMSLNGTYYSQPYISFVAGNQYKFYVSDSSVATYNLVFGNNGIANTSLYTVVGTSGQPGAYVLLDVGAGYSGSTIEYFDLTRSAMGYVSPPVATAEITSTLTNGITSSQVFITPYEDNIIYNSYYSNNGGSTFTYESNLGYTGGLTIHNNKYGVLWSGITTAAQYKVFSLSNPSLVNPTTGGRTVSATLHTYIGSEFTVDKTGKRITFVTGFGKPVSEIFSDLALTNRTSTDIYNHGAGSNFTIILTDATSPPRLVASMAVNGSSQMANYSLFGTTYTALSKVTSYYNNGGYTSMFSDGLKQLYCSGNGKYFVCMGVYQIAVSNDSGTTWYKIRETSTYATTGGNQIFVGNGVSDPNNSSFLSGMNVETLNPGYASLSYDGKYISIYRVDSTGPDCSYSFTSSDYGNSFTKVANANPVKVANVAEGTVFSLKTTKNGTTYSTIKTTHPTTVVKYYVKVINSKFWLSTIYGSNGAAPGPLVDLSLSTYNQTYVFDQSDPSNTGHLLVFGFTRDLTSSIITYQKVTGTPGQNGAYTTFRNRDDSLFYFSYNETGFGTP